MLLPNDYRFPTHLEMHQLAAAARRERARVVAAMIVKLFRSVHSRLTSTDDPIGAKPAF